MPPSERICRACNAMMMTASDRYVGWCSSCQRYDYEIYDGRKATPAEPIQLDVILADIQRQLRFRPSLESMVELGIEPTRDPTRDVLCFRAFIKVNGKVAEYSRRSQATPQDAIRELYHLCMGTKPEDI